MSRARREVRKGADDVKFRRRELSELNSVLHSDGSFLCVSHPVSHECFVAALAILNREQARKWHDIKADQ